MVLGKIEISLIVTEDEGEKRLCFKSPDGIEIGPSFTVYKSGNKKPRVSVSSTYGGDLTSYQAPLVKAFKSIILDKWNLIPQGN